MDAHAGPVDALAACAASLPAGVPRRLNRRAIISALLVALLVWTVRTRWHVAHEDRPHIGEGANKAVREMSELGAGDARDSNILVAHELAHARVAAADAAGARATAMRTDGGRGGRHILLADVCAEGHFSNQLISAVAAVSVARLLGRSIVEFVFCESGGENRPFGRYFDTGVVNAYLALDGGAGAVHGADSEHDAHVPRMLSSKEYAAAAAAVRRATPRRTADCSALRQCEMAHVAQCHASVDGRVLLPVPCLLFKTAYVGRKLPSVPWVLRALRGTGCAAAAVVLPDDEGVFDPAQMWSRYADVRCLEDPFDPSQSALSRAPIPFDDAPIVAAWYMYGLLPALRDSARDGWAPLRLGDLRVRQEIVDVARRKLLALGGPNGYVAAHVRLRDYSSYCVRRNATTVDRPCGVDMARAPRAIAEALQGARLRSLFIATDGSAADVSALVDGVRKLVADGPVDITVSVTSDDVNAAGAALDADDGIVLQLAEKLVLSCAKTLLTTARSTFSAHAVEMRGQMGECGSADGWTVLQLPTFTLA